MKQAIAIVVVSLVAPAVVHADAGAHVSRATELHKAGKFHEALEEMKTAYALDPKPSYLYAMGQMSVKLGDCVQASAFYDRFLATRPSPEIAAQVHEAIAACVPAIESVAPVAPVAQIDVALPPPPVVAVQPVVIHRRAIHWYDDHVADALVAGGVLAGLGGLALYGGALADRDRASTAQSYDGVASLNDRARAMRTYAVVVGATGAALIVTGVVHALVRASRADDVQIAPTDGGATLSWAGSF